MYEVFVYLDEMKRLRGDYDGIQYVNYLPRIGQHAGTRNGDDYYVTGVYDTFGIIDVVCERRSKK